jgi:hypothetical protein
MNPNNPVLGQREVIRLMDAGVSLSQHFGIDLASLLPSANSNPSPAFPAGRGGMQGDEA